MGRENIQGKTMSDTSKRENRRKGMHIILV